MSSEIWCIVWLKIGDEEVVDIGGMFLCFLDIVIDAIDRVDDGLVIDESFDCYDHQNNIENQ